MDGCCIVGAGAWGSALAIHLARQGLPVVLTGQRPEALRDMAARRENTASLPGCGFPPCLSIEPDLTCALRMHRDIILAGASHALPGLIPIMRTHLPAHARIAWAFKGLASAEGALVHDYLQDALGVRPYAVFSGPAFAAELAAGLPCAVALAATQQHWGDELAAALHDGRFRVYRSDDLVGIQVGGASKNVIAIACGVADGMCLGASTRAVLVTRGLAEMLRLNEALGGIAETLMGLSGLGDLVLTATDNHSRNRRLGLCLGQGWPVASARAMIGQVTEGYYAASIIHGLALRHGLRMPITAQVAAVLHEGRPVLDALAALTAPGQPRQEWP